MSVFGGLIADFVYGSGGSDSEIENEPDSDVDNINSTNEDNSDEEDSNSCFENKISGEAH